MANYNLVIDSTFQPFSFERYIQPLTIYGEAYNSLEGALTELSTKAGEFEALAESEKLRNGENSATYKRYSTYSQDLKKQADELATRGLGIGNRKALMDLKTRYSTEIKPIQEAKDTLKTLMDERRKLEIANPTLKYERDFTEVGVDELLLNPDLTYGETYTGSLIEEQVGKAAQALMKQIRTEPKYKKILGNQYYQSKIQQGYTAEEVLLAAAEDPRAPKELSELVNSALINSGVYSWEGMYDENGNLTKKGQDVIKDVKSYISRGLNHAVGTTSYGTIANRAYDYVPPKPPTPQPDLLVRHWSTPLGKEELDRIKKLRGLMGGIFTKDANGNMLFVTGKDGKKYNPMMIYEEYNRYMKENPSYTTSMVSYSPGSAMPSYKNNTAENALKYIQDTYGINPITNEQYNLLKELGYDSVTPVQAFDSLPRQINTMITQYNPTSLNAANYDNLSERFYGALDREDLEDDISIKRVDTDGTRHEVESSELFDDNGKAKFNISDMAYSLQNPTKVYMQIGGKVYEVDLNKFGTEAAEIGMMLAGEDLSNYSGEEISSTQDKAAYILRQLLHGWAANPTETMQGGQ